MDSATHSRYTQKMESAWLGLIMLTLFAIPTDPEADCGNSMITNTGSATFDPMNTKMPPGYFRTSGPKSMLYLRNGE